MLTLCYIAQHGSKGYYNSKEEKISHVKRCICLPDNFEDVECRKSAKDACILFKNKKKQIHKIYAIDMHLVDHVIENICEIRIKKILDTVQEEEEVDEDMEMERGKRKRKRHITEERKDTPVRFCWPRVLNICCKVVSEDGVEYSLNEACKSSCVTSMQHANITQGDAINSSICKGVLKKKDNSLRIVAVVNVKESLKLLSRMCNVSPDATVSVHMVLMRGNLPHCAIISYDRSVLHRSIGEFLPSEGIAMRCDVWEMDECMVDIKVLGKNNMWHRWAAALEKLTGKSETAYAEALSKVEEKDRDVVKNTDAKIKVTHFGSVSIQFTWSNKREGQLMWTEENRNVLRCMSSMIMRFLEMCT